jgi:hypothetical protein
MDYVTIIGFAACDYDYKCWIVSVLNREEDSEDNIAILLMADHCHTCTLQDQTSYEFIGMIF